MKVSCTLVAYMTTSPQSKFMRLAEARLFTKFLAGASSVMSLHLDGHSVGKACLQIMNNNRINSVHCYMHN